MKNLKLSNYNKKTTPKYKLIGDLALVLIPAIQVVLISAPEGVLTPAQSWFVGGITSVILVLIKFATKFTDGEQKDN